jgi:hypothetical protein
MMYGRCTLIRHIIFIILFFASYASAANVYIDPDCGTPGDGSSGVCGGVGTDPHDSLMDVTFSSSDDYYVKRGTTDTVTTEIDIDASGADTDNRLIVGAYWLDGATPTFTENGDARPIIIRNSVADGTAAILVSGNFVELKHLDIRQGEKSLRIGNKMEFLGEDAYVHDCTIGGGANTQGVRVLGQRLVMHDCDIDPMYSTYSQAGTVGDGISFDNWGHYAEIYNCHVSNWHHANIQLTKGDYNKIYNIYSTNSDDQTGSPVQIGLQADYNEVHDILAENAGDYFQLGGGSYNKIWNIIINSTCCDIETTDDGDRTFNIASHSGNTVGNEIHNITIYTHDKCFEFYWSGVNDLENNIVDGLVCYSDGDGIEEANDDRLISVTGVSTAFGPNTVRNIQIYWSEGTPNIRYYSGEDPITDWESLETNGDTIENIQVGDPLFATNFSDLTLQSGSPAIDLSSDQAGEPWDKGLLTGNWSTYTFTYAYGIDNDGRMPGAYQNEISASPPVSGAQSITGGQGGFGSGYGRIQ